MSDCDDERRGHPHAKHPPHGWYYYGPEPPWAGGAAGGGAGPHADGKDLMEAFDRLSRGEMNAETLGHFLNPRDREFWKGALLGSMAALALANMPALKAMAAGLAGQAAQAARGGARPGGATGAGEETDTDEEKENRT